METDDIALASCPATALTYRKEDVIAERIIKRHIVTRTEPASPIRKLISRVIHKEYHLNPTRQTKDVELNVIDFDIEAYVVGTALSLSL